MKQSNPIRKLEAILSEAIESADKNSAAASILLQKMKLELLPENIIYFYGLLNKAKEEAQIIRNRGNIDRDINAINQLNTIFTTNVIWSTPWINFEVQIRDKNILSILNALANYSHDQNPRFLLEEDILVKIETEFQSLLNELGSASLSHDLKKIIINNIENIITAIKTYNLSGTEGLEKAAKSLLSDLLMVENNIKDEDKINPVYNLARAWGLSIVLWITPPPYSEVWKPTFEKLNTDVQQVRQMLSEAPTNIQEAFQKASHGSSEPQKRLPGETDRKSLPPSKDVI
jgi:hypothetical protein